MLHVHQRESLVLSKEVNVDLTHVMWSTFCCTIIDTKSQTEKKKLKRWHNNASEKYKNLKIIFDALFHESLSNHLLCMPYIAL